MDTFRAVFKHSVHVRSQIDPPNGLPQPQDLCSRPSALTILAHGAISRALAHPDDTKLAHDLLQRWIKQKLLKPLQSWRENTAGDRLSLKLLFFLVASPLFLAPQKKISILPPHFHPSIHFRHRLATPCASPRPSRLAPRPRAFQYPQSHTRRATVASAASHQTRHVARLPSRLSSPRSGVSVGRDAVSRFPKNISLKIRPRAA